MNLDKTRLESLEIGPMPIARQYMERLGLGEILARHLPRPTRGRPCEVPPEEVLCTMIANILISRSPLYAVPEWLDGFVPELTGLDDRRRAMLNDDRVGREIDRLFDADPMAVFTDVVVAAVRKFGLRLNQLHSDSTSVTVHGDYKKTADPRRRRPPKITRGFNKDHRPDLKQLVAEMAMTADGNVPIYFKAHDGNMPDDKMHCDTWTSLKELVGSPDFLYVADCKLAVSETMRFIDDANGRFLSVLPRTRNETKDFFEHLRVHSVDWEVVRREDNPDFGKIHVPTERPDPGCEDVVPFQPKTFVYHAIESPRRSREGFRIFWYRSSQKTHEDEERRSNQLIVAKMGISALEASLAKGRPLEPADAMARAELILKEQNVQGLLTVSVSTDCHERLVQDGAGRPGPNTRYRKIATPFLRFEVKENAEAIQAAAVADGLFPLVTNCPTLTPKSALEVYKRQPFLEKRHQQLKSVLDMTPIYLKSPTRIASLLLLDYLALLIYSLIERDVRNEMKREKVKSLPLYSERRESKAPTTDSVFDAFRGLRRHRLVGEDGAILRTFYDTPSAVACRLMPWLGVRPEDYGQSP